MRAPQLLYRRRRHCLLLLCSATVRPTAPREQHPPAARVTWSGRDMTHGSLRRLVRRNRSRLLFIPACLVLVYFIHQGPSAAAPAAQLPAADTAASQHRRVVLQRANSSSAVQQGGDVRLKPATTVTPKPQRPTAGDDREIQAVLEVDVPRDSPLKSVTAAPEPSVGGVDEEALTLPDYDVEELEGVLESRRKRVREVCEATGLEKQGHPNAWEFFIDHRHHLIWCNVFKAASSTWMYNFNLLAGYKEDYLRRSRKTPLVLARARFPRPSVAQLKEALPSYMSFMIVRDPFERLVSAYRNKIEAFRHKFYRKMAREMIAKYRKAGSRYEGLKGPSFSEFVMHVVDTADKPDEHWAPYYQFCTPCHVNFTVIAQVETLTRDQEYVIRHAGLADELSLGRRGHREALNKARGAPTSELLEKYFRQLSREQLLALYRIYRIDFDMFGYDADKYFRMLNEPEPGIK
ncbi:hypothetical protein B566_EDAN008396 [Ephemera danica]|nr:hypothetical protein B566_EDAN008396 [Ephemera danica]